MYFYIRLYHPRQPGFRVTAYRQHTIYNGIKLSPFPFCSGWLKKRVLALVSGQDDTDITKPVSAPLKGQRISISCAHRRNPLWSPGILASDRRRARAGKT